MAESKAPELVLHVGMPKAGSTALQKMLQRHSRALEAEGVFYPRIDRGVAHQFLNIPLDFANSAPRLLRHFFNSDSTRARKHFETTWSLLSSMIDKAEPNTVVLSCEGLFSRANLHAEPDLFELIRTKFSRAVVVIYVRSPASYAASAMQQHVKHSGTLRSVSPPNYRRNIEAWERRFPGAVVVKKYERAALHCGDIFNDFSKSFMNVNLGDAIKPSSFNTSMSAEAASVMQEFQRRFYPDKDDVPMGIKKTLRASLRASERMVKPPKARLRPEWASYLDESCEDLLWLRDRYGLEFANIDYGRIGSQDAPGPDPDLIAELFQVDNRVRRRLKFLSHLMVPRLWKYMLR